MRGCNAIYFVLVLLCNYLPALACWGIKDNSIRHFAIGVIVVCGLVCACLVVVKRK